MYFSLRVFILIMLIQFEYNIKEKWIIHGYSIFSPITVIASTGHMLPAALVVMCQRCWDLRKSPIFCSQTRKSEPVKTGMEALRLLLLVLATIDREFLKRNFIVSSLLTTMISKKKKTPLYHRGSMPMCGALDHNEGACHRKGRGYRYKWWASRCPSCAS